MRSEIHKPDRAFAWILAGSAAGLIALLGAIVFEVFGLSLPALKALGVEFFFINDWNPVTDEFGAAAFAYGTVVSSLLALFIATPVSVCTALFITEIAPKQVARVIGFLVEMLAAIPSVVYGLWGVFVLAPWLRTSVEPVLGRYLGWIPLFQGPPYGVGMLAAGVILAIMITPTITTVSREVFRTTPRANREAALALGATKSEMIRLAVLRGSVSGIFGAVFLGLGRALGETMAVTMVIGNRADISLSLFAPSQTMASLIANEYAEATSDMHLSALAAVGFGLLLVSVITNGLARILVWTPRKGKP